MLLPSPIHATVRPLELRAELLLDGLEVRHDLAGVQQVGEAVDDRNGGVARQLLDLLVGEGADHDAVHVSGQHLGGVVHRLATAHLAVAIGKEERVPPELGHPHLEGHPGAGGALAEDHGQALAGQEEVAPSSPDLSRAARSRRARSSSPGEVGDGQEVTLSGCHLERMGLRVGRIDGRRTVRGCSVAGPRRRRRFFRRSRTKSPSTSRVRTPDSGRSNRTSSSRVVITVWRRRAPMFSMRSLSSVAMRAICSRRRRR